MDQHGILAERIHHLDKSRSGYTAAITKLCNEIDRGLDCKNLDILRDLKARLSGAFERYSQCCYQYDNLLDPDCEKYRHVKEHFELQKQRVLSYNRKIDIFTVNAVMELQVTMLQEEIKKRELELQRTIEETEKNLSTPNSEGIYVEPVCKDDLSNIVIPPPQMFKDVPEMLDPLPVGEQVKTSTPLGDTTNQTHPIEDLSTILLPPPMFASSEILPAPALFVPRNENNDTERKNSPAKPPGDVSTSPMFYSHVSPPGPALHMPSNVNDNLEHKIDMMIPLSGDMLSPMFSTPDAPPGSTLHVPRNVDVKLPRPLPGDEDSPMFSAQRIPSGPAYHMPRDVNDCRPRLSFNLGTYDDTDLKNEFPSGPASFVPKTVKDCKSKLTFDLDTSSSEIPRPPPGETLTTERSARSHKDPPTPTCHENANSSLQGGLFSAIVSTMDKISLSHDLPSVKIARFNGSPEQYPRF